MLQVRATGSNRSKILLFDPNCLFYIFLIIIKCNLKEKIAKITPHPGIEPGPSG